MTQPTPGGNVVDRRMALAREWDDLVEQVRRLDGFEDFLRPPRLENLLPAAAHGPVAIINVSRWRCDALLVRPGGVTAQPLASLSLADATDRANDYLAVLHDAELADLEHVQAQVAVPGESAHGAARRRLKADRAVEAAHERVDTMLHDLQDWMWRTIAEPVLEALGFTATPGGDPATWPRLWWCPTGPLTLLPLHTAGDHVGAVGGDTPARTVLDRVVSSYTPTLRALLEARRPDDPQGPARGRDRLLLVDVPDAPGQIPLDTTTERAALLAAFPEGRRTVLDRDAATRAEVRAALPEHRWVHFSCHGDQDLKDPSRGGLVLRDATLTIADVTEGRFHGDFAGLSACKTAVGGVDLLDEAITLAAAMHYTGYRHVVAALWSVDNRTSSEVFADLYRTIATDGRIEPDRAPAALHRVVREQRDRHPAWPHRWTPFAHTGP
ncbi:MAG: CHAT domain-containing protein [Pseudonocardia sp.]